MGEVVGGCRGQLDADPAFVLRNVALEADGRVDCSLLRVYNRLRHGKDRLLCRIAQPHFPRSRDRCGIGNALQFFFDWFSCESSIAT